MSLQNKSNSLKSQYISLSTSPDACPTVEDQVSGEEGQTPISCPSLVANHGLDTIHLYYHAEIKNVSLLQELKEAKEAIQAGSEDEQKIHCLGGSSFNWNLQRTGIKLFPYVLRSGDIIFGLSNRTHESTIPNICLLVGSMSSQQDPLALIRSFKLNLQQYKITCLNEKVSRVDICADIKISLGETETDNIHKYISRARDISIYTSHRKYTGVQIGKGSVVARIYDKQLEMRNKRDFEKQMFFNELWQTSKDDNVVRVEFQIRRDWIKKHFNDDSTLKTIISKVSQIWQYMTEEWLRQATSEVDAENKHQSRCVTSDFWECVQAASLHHGERLPRDKKQLHINIPDLIRQSAGCLMSVAAGFGHTFDDHEGIMATIDYLVKEEILEILKDHSKKNLFETKATKATVTF